MEGLLLLSCFITLSFDFIVSVCLSALGTPLRSLCKMTPNSETKRASVVNNWKANKTMAREEEEAFKMSFQWRNQREWASIGAYRHLHTSWLSPSDDYQTTANERGSVGKGERQERKGKDTRRCNAKPKEQLADDRKNKWPVSCECWCEHSKWPGQRVCSVLKIKSRLLQFGKCFKHT